ncbi:MAG: GlsB/YeaQ/YmgE family stress response membrane protein [Chloroflexi bacterium]|nr:GlsB/YeaQ/YmgE family stress response membrane protein [Chloroflexota bacterium]
MGILSWIIVGLIAGWLAGQVMRGGGYGLIGDIVLGIVGGLVGGYLAGALFGVPDAVNGINVVSIVVAFVGAILLIAVSRMFFHPRSA